MFLVRSLMIIIMILIMIISYLYLEGICIYYKPSGEKETREELEYFLGFYDLLPDIDQ